MQTQNLPPEAGQQLHVAEAFAIDLPPDIRHQVQSICTAEAITFEEFVRLALESHRAHQAHLDWLKSRKIPTQASIEAARRILRRPSTRPPDLGDELPEGW